MRHVAILCPLRTDHTKQPSPRKVWLDLPSNQFWWSYHHRCSYHRAATGRLGAAAASPLTKPPAMLPLVVVRAWRWPSASSPPLALPCSST